MVRKWTGCVLVILLCLVTAAAGAEFAKIVNADATSWIVGKNPKSYIPANMIDDKEETSFQFSLKDIALGQEYLYFDLKGPSDFDSLWIKNGFWKVIDGYDQYVRNSRISWMTISFMYSPEGGYVEDQEILLPDDRLRQEWTQIDLGNKYGVRSVRIRVDGIYEGTKYPNDVCVSEVRFWSGGPGLYALAIDNLATRTGPSPGYEGKKTYNVKGQYIKILTRAFDSRNGIWWVKCEIPYREEILVLWTGWKRFDPDSLSLERIPIDPDYPSVK